jgi:hypothetical protein
MTPIKNDLNNEVKALTTMRCNKIIRLCHIICTRAKPIETFCGSLKEDGWYAFLLKSFLYFLAQMRNDF